MDMGPGERLVPIREITSGKATMLATRSPRAEDGCTTEPLLRVCGLSKTFVIRKAGWLASKVSKPHVAVDDVSFDIMRGECLGLVGESGCGKTVTSKIIMRALAPDAGEVRFNSNGRATDVLALEGDALLDYRRKVQYIFQDPFGSLNPRMTVFDIVSEPLIIHKIGTPDERAEMVKELMRLVGLDVRCLRRYPHSFSGGQRQRIGIARALALRPEILVCDEPVSALDVSIQAQVLNLLKDLKKELGLTYLFISHNLAVIDYIADRIAVMCAGRLIEIARQEKLFATAVHPYTKALLAAVPEPDPTHPLDFGALEAGRCSDPAAWPAPFTSDGSTGAELVDLGDGHMVRASGPVAQLRVVS